MAMNLDAIRTMVREELPKWDQPSISLGIIKDGEVVMAEGFGYRNYEEKLPCDADTMYQIGSCSKAFTAATIAALVDEGKLGWDVPVRTYMPWLEFKEAYTSDHVTVRDLLCHRTGLPRHDAFWIDGPCTRKEVVENLRNMQPCWSFRSEWCYQNSCFVAAGVLIETVTGLSWENAVKKYIFDPLGMTRSSFYVDVISNDADHADPYDRVNPTDLTGIVKVPFMKSDREDMAAGIGAPYGPAGSIMSTVNDMLKWTAFNLNEGKVGDKQIISEPNMKELHKPQMLLSAPLLGEMPEQDFHSYGLGWFLESQRGHKMVEHGGNINGFSALVTMIPDRNLGIVALTNFNDSFNTYASTYEIIDADLGVTGGNWHNRWRDLVSGIFGSLPEQMKQLRGEQILNTVPSHPLSDYAGTYTNPTYGDAVVTLEEDGLHFTYNKAVSPLQHFHYDVFTITDVHHLLSGMNLQFATDTHGKVASFSVGIVMNPAAKDEVFTRKEQ